MMRDGLRALLAKERGVEVVGEAQDGREVLRLAEKLRPDVVLMDIGMRDLNGIETTRILTSRQLDLKVVALSMHSHKQLVMGMIRAGASAYVLKDCAFRDLAVAVRHVIEGRHYLSPNIVGVVLQDCVAKNAGDSAGCAMPGEGLTARQREVLQLIAEGVTTKDIACRLHVSAKTVETHRKQIMERLNLHSVAELTKYAVREGLTSLDT